MSIRFTCPCGKSLEAFDELVGQKYRCGGCGTWLVVPAPDQAFLPAEIVSGRIRSETPCSLCREPMPTRLRVCPKCGWNEEEKKRYCAVCVKEAEIRSRNLTLPDLGVRGSAAAVFSLHSSFNPGAMLDSALWGLVAVCVLEACYRSASERRSIPMASLPLYRVGRAGKRETEPHRVAGHSGVTA